MWERHHARVSARLGHYEYVTRNEWKLWQRFTCNLLRTHFINLNANNTLISMPPSTFMDDNYLYGWRWTLSHNAKEHRFNFSLTGPNGYFHMFHFSDVRQGTVPVVKRIPLTERAYLILDGNVDPLAHRRLHTIVRDTDCVGQRDERFWVTIVEK